jgi:serine/threonine protein kinase
MAKDKDKSPFSDDLPSGIDLGGEDVKQKIRRRKSPDDPKELLTSSDLFGEIIEELGEEPRGPAAASSARSSATESSSPPVEGGNKEERPAVRPDTISVKQSSDSGPEESGGSAGEVYSLVDLAYSTLLQDSKLSRQVDVLGREDPAVGKGADAAYGQYLLLERIATGGMAEVFRAKRQGVEGFEKIVAVKRILPHLSDNKEFVEMFINEAKMVAGLSHPNIVQIFDLGKIEDTYYIAMEYIDGRDLRSILARAHGQDLLLDVDLTALIATKVVSALEYAHRHHDAAGKPLRIVHRDVSPPNILISRDGQTKLVDFGIAKAAIKASHTDSGSLRGKLLYMSPEQAWGRPIDNRSDIFSLGVVLFEMLTGRTLFMGTSEVSILDRVREARFLTPSSFNPSVPIELEAVVAKALKKNPAERYQDASEMTRDLDSYLRRRPAVGVSDLADFVSKLFGEDRLPEANEKTNPGATT